VIYNELLKSVTATAKGISNIPNAEQKQNLQRLVEILNLIGKEVDYPVIVISGFRSPELNKIVGGSSNSHHLLGYAADLSCENVEGLRDIIVEKYMVYIDQIIYYSKRNFLHISIHPSNRRMYFEL